MVTLSRILLLRTLVGKVVPVEWLIISVAATTFYSGLRQPARRLAAIRPLVKVAV